MFILFKGAIPLVKSDERICWDVSKFMNVHPNLVPVAMDCASRMASPPPPPRADSPPPSKQSCT
jgi:hypothetical protein